MPVVIDKALDLIGEMNTSVPSPHPMDESTAKGIFKYLKELGIPVTSEDVITRGSMDGWNGGFIKKVAGWADKINSGERVVIKHPKYFSSDMREILHHATSIKQEP